MRTGTFCLMARGKLLSVIRLTRISLTILPATIAGTSLAAQSRPASDNPIFDTHRSSAATPADGETRGMWVVRTSLVSPKSIRQVVSTAVRFHLNTLFVQVRGRGDAYYASPDEPRAEALAGQPADFDPLDTIVKEAHKAGIQVHAWMNTFLTWSGPVPPTAPNHLWNAHRDWFAADREGIVSPIPTNKCEGAFLQPSNPAVQDHLFRVFTFVASHYDVDGIQFDYCRYANSGQDYSTAAIGRFRDAISPSLTQERIAAVDAQAAADRVAWPRAFPLRWADWRREQITSLVQRISAAVKHEKPWLQVSAAVFPDADEAYSVKGQDWKGWIKTGSLDGVALMAYEKSTSHVMEDTRRAVALAGENRFVYTGIGAWRLSAVDVARKIAAARAAGASGVNLFSYDGVHRRPDYLDTLARGVFASRCAPRRLRWLPDPPAPLPHR
jgi:uncharacterized lipoprotein YddW (UPF0748 family)